MLRKNLLLLLILFMVLSTFSHAKVLYTLDFTKHKDGDAKAWLRSKGFTFKLDASKLSMKFKEHKLVIETSKQKAGMFGIEFPPSHYLKNIGSVKIVWGVDRFPKGANWAKGNNRLAIGTIFTLGTKKISSGLPLGIHKAPTFLGPFIGEKERVGKEYVGKLYKKGGRYYCVSNKCFGKTVVTHFNIDKKYQQAFKEATPALTAFAFQMNTKNTTGGAKAFIKSITFYSK